VDGASSDDQARVTRLLGAWVDGDLHARDELLPIVYDTLRRLAQHYLAGKVGNTFTASPHISCVRC